MFEKQNKTGKEEDNSKHTSDASSCNRADSHNQQRLNKKRYAVKLIEKRTGLLFFCASLVFVFVSAYLISNKELYVYRDVQHVLAFSKNVKAFEFDGYKTIRNSVGFEMLSDKFKRKSGFYGIQYSPQKRKLTVYVNDSIVTEKDIRKVLHTKTKCAICYPEDSKKRLFRYRLTVDNYYDSFDGLIFKRKLQSIKGIYFIESVFKSNLHIDIFGDEGLDIGVLKAKIEDPTVVMFLKKRPTEIRTDYVVNSVEISESEKERKRIQNKIFIKNSFEATTLVEDRRRLDTLRLALKKFPLQRKLPFSGLLADVEIKKFHIQSIKATNTVSPELQIVFVSKRSTDKGRLFLLLSRPFFTHISRGNKKVVHNPYVFAIKN
jgi:hypothetical protein